MATNKIPIRMCIVCRENKPKKELIRIVKTDNGFDLDFTGKLNGRGAYICNNIECFDAMYKRKVLNKCFKQNVTTEEYEYLRGKFLEHRED